jgi:hypothetical protein
MDDGGRTSPETTMVPSNKRAFPGVMHPSCAVNRMRSRRSRRPVRSPGVWPKAGLGNRRTGKRFFECGRWRRPPPHLAVTATPAAPATPANPAARLFGSLRARDGPFRCLPARRSRSPSDGHERPDVWPGPYYLLFDDPAPNVLSIVVGRTDPNQPSNIASLHSNSGSGV